MMHIWVHDKPIYKVVNLWKPVLRCTIRWKLTAELFHTPTFVLKLCQVLQTNPLPKLSPLFAVLLPVQMQLRQENSLSLSVSLRVGKLNLQEQRMALTLWWIKVRLKVYAQGGNWRLLPPDSAVMEGGFHDNDALFRDKWEGTWKWTFMYPPLPPTSQQWTILVAFVALWREREMLHL